MFKKGLAALLLAACMLCMSACWDHVEITNMLIVAGIGLDLDDTGDGYHAVVEIVNVATDDGDNMVSRIVEGKGATIYSAIQDAMVMTGGTMFSNHCKVVVIGDKLARHGISEIVDLVLRSPNLRKTMDVLIAQNTTAHAILTETTVKNNIISFELSRMLHSNADTLNNTSVIGMYQLHGNFLSDTPAAAVPVVFPKENNEKTVLSIEGVAVFREEKLQGYLSGAQSAIRNIGTQKVENGSIVVSDNALSPAPLEAKLLNSNVRLTPGIQGGDRLSMRVEIDAAVTLQEAALLRVDLNQESAVKQIEESLERQLEADIKALITDVQQQFGTDIFYFHQAFENHYQRQWETLKTDWPSHFRDIEVEVTADVMMTGSGMIGNFVPAGNEANALP